MQTELAPIYSWASRVSRSGVLLLLALLGIVRIFVGEISLSYQLVIALFALLVGIPHGAIDHLISIPSKPKSRFFAYIFIYIAIAFLSGWFIAANNVLGFQIIVIMSAIHFGFGDASYLNEKADSSSKPRHPFWIETLYAIPAGFLPVLLPLTDHRTLKALNRINPKLDSWAGSEMKYIRIVTLFIAIISILVFLLVRELSLVVDLALLAALSMIAPPLIAFATYFGFWHAIRHTARLVPQLARAKELAMSGHWQAALWAAIKPGLYAVVGTIAIAALLMVKRPAEFSSSLLWSTLVIIWALTVPHMISTARFDRFALKSK